MAYIGRFAPSPTGPLHFGSFVAALASWLDARSVGGRWLLRVEDLDPLREQQHAADTILRQLESAGLWWDGNPTYQSLRAAHYEAALDALTRRGHLYPCACTRKEIADSALGTDGTPVYPGTCRRGLPPGRTARALRLRTSPESIRFEDRVQGDFVQCIEREIGDFVLRRADGFYAYQLAVVVDDGEAGVTDVVRGADLLGSTPRQIALQRLLGLPVPRYAHVPVAFDGMGEKLSKQTGAHAISQDNVHSVLRSALAFLGQAPEPTLAPRELLPWAIQTWQMTRVPRTRAQPVPTELDRRQ